MPRFTQDLRYALRMMGKNPGFIAAAVAGAASGILASFRRGTPARKFPVRRHADSGVET
jgi:hypothetical protein